MYTTSRKHELLLPKGRKNDGERNDAASIRETREETGYNVQHVYRPFAKTATIPRQTTTNSVKSFQQYPEPFYLTIALVQDLIAP